MLNLSTVVFAFVRNSLEIASITSSAIFNSAKIVRTEMKINVIFTKSVTLAVIQKTIEYHVHKK